VFFFQILRHPDLQLGKRALFDEPTNYKCLGRIVRATSCVFYLFEQEKKRNETQYALKTDFVIIIRQICTLLDCVWMFDIKQD